MVSALSWWLAIQLCGILALPLAWRLFARLPGRGYPFAKALGLLLAAYILWLGASFHLLANDLGGIVAALLVLGGISFWLGRPALAVPRPAAGAPGRRPLLAWLAANRRLVLTTEALFLVAFAAWTFFRAHSGEISATEKPMEFAFTNGVLNSRFFPPQDPWLSGYAISYYYFGYVMLAFLIRLTGVLPAVGFNLGVALWYALVLIAAFGVVYELVALAAARTAPGAKLAGREDDAAALAPPGRALGWGLVAAFFAGAMGNLEGVVEAAYNARLAPAALVRWLDIKDLLTNPPTGTWAGTGWWWWHASRVIHDKDLLGASVEVIDEFPFFSFLLGDLHPHVLALPFVLLAIALALNLFLAARSWPAGTAGLAAAEDLSLTAAQAVQAEPAVLGFVTDLEGPALRLQRGVAGLWRGLGAALGLGTPGILLYALAFGALAFLNTWDFPIYLALAVLAFGAGLALTHGLSRAVVVKTAGVGLILGVIGYAAYLPFYLGFQSQAGGLLPNLLFPTRFSQFFLMFGPFLVTAIFFLALVTGALRRRNGPQATPVDAGTGRHFLRVLAWPLFGPLILVCALLLLAVALPQGRTLITNLLADPAVRSRLPVAGVGPLVGLIAQVRLATPWTYLFLAAMIAWTVAVLWSALAHDHAGQAPADHADPAAAGQSPALPLPDLFALLLIGLALVLAFSVEFVYLRDFFGTRMNTVFKFYYQAWILLALAAAYGLSRLADRRVSLRLAMPALLLALLLGAAGFVYPLLATPSKAGDFRGPATLDGLAYLGQYDQADAAAIAWLRATVTPTAVVLEAPGGSYSTEGAERISMSTGNPTLLGWDFHERQWRGAAFDRLTAGRLDAIDRIYRSARPGDLPALLDQWHVNYVYIGALERRKYGITDAALARFTQAGLPLVYDAQGVRIYAR